MKWFASALLLGLVACVPGGESPVLTTEPLIQVWLPTGVTVRRSEALHGADLPRELAAGTGQQLAWADLPNGRPARMIGMRWVVPTPLGSQALEVVVASNATPYERTLKSLAGLLLAAWGAASIGLAAVLFLVVRRGLAPLDRLGVDIKNLDASNLSGDIHSPGAPAELRPVVDQLNAMIERLRIAFDQEHAFSSHAAHELRTPLAGLRSTLELMLTRPRSVEEHARFAERCLEMTLELQGTVNSLLELARPVKGQRDVRETTNVVELLMGAWKDRSESATTRGISFKVTPQTPVKIETDSRLFEALIKNLVDNAVEYSPEGGAIRCFASLREGNLSCIVINPAPDLTHADGRRALEAFWRRDPSRRATGRHAGLGLALSRRIAERLGGRLHVRAAKGRFHARVVLPRGID